MLSVLMCLIAAATVYGQDPLEDPAPPVIEVPPAVPIQNAPPGLRVPPESCLAVAIRPDCPPITEARFFNSVPVTTENTTALLSEILDYLKCRPDAGDECTTDSQLASMSMLVALPPCASTTPPSCSADDVYRAVMELVGDHECDDPRLCSLEGVEEAVEDLLGTIYCDGSEPCRTINEVYGILTGLVNQVIEIVNQLDVVPDPGEVGAYLEPPMPIALYGVPDEVPGIRTEEDYGACTGEANTPKSDEDVVHAVSSHSCGSRYVARQELSANVQRWVPRDRYWQNLANKFDAMNGPGLLLASPSYDCYHFTTRSYRNRTFVNHTMKNGKNYSTVITSNTLSDTCVVQ